jgi:hypothetical protein
MIKIVTNGQYIIIQLTWKPSGVRWRNIKIIHYHRYKFERRTHSWYYMMCCSSVSCMGLLDYDVGLFQWCTQEFFWGVGVQQIQLGKESRENVDLEAVAPPSQGFHSICKWMKPVFVLGCYGCIFHRTGNSVQLCQNVGIWGGGFELPKPGVGYTAGLFTVFSLYTFFTNTCTSHYTEDSFI